MPETILYFAHVWCVPVILYAYPLLEIYDSQPPKIHNFAPEIDPPSEIFFWLLPWCSSCMVCSYRNFKIIFVKNLFANLDYG